MSISEILSKKETETELLTSPIGVTSPIEIAGFTGPTGPAGRDGRDGRDGKGIAGPAGRDGMPGPTGSIGPEGLIGPTGPTGYGERGYTGEQGRDGPTGPTGPLGGPTGPIGPRGYTGEKGNDGPIGPQGPQGNAGPEGPAGPAGNAGVQGPMGPQGIQGRDGYTGPTGPAGPQADGILWCMIKIKLKQAKYDNDCEFIPLSRLAWIVETMKTSPAKLEIIYRCVEKRHNLRVNSNYTIIQMILTHVTSKPNVTPLRVESLNEELFFEDNFLPGTVYDLWIAMAKQT